MSEADLLWKLIAVASTLCALAVSVTTLFRRRPPLSEEIYRDFATKVELACVRAEFNTTMKEFFQRQHINQSTIEDKFQTIMLSIGRMEGKIEEKNGDY